MMYSLESRCVGLVRWLLQECIRRPTALVCAMLIHHYLNNRKENISRSRRRAQDRESKRKKENTTGGIRFTILSYLHSFVRLLYFSFDNHQQAMLPLLLRCWLPLRKRVEKSEEKCARFAHCIVCICVRVCRTAYLSKLIVCPSIREYHYSKRNSHPSPILFGRDHVNQYRKCRNYSLY